jgi:molecular chaperone HscB
MPLDFKRNHFELFALPARYRIDQAALGARYRELQGLLHPDRHAGAGDTQRRLALQAASRVNEAYQTLKDPLLRAQYLLTLGGVDFDEHTDTATDTGFLMAQMELRERLAELREAHGPLAELEAFGGELRRRSALLSEAFEARWAAGDLEAAREEVLKMRFFRRLEQELAMLEEHLEDALS